VDAPSTVDDYLAALPERSRAVLEQARALIKATAPDADEGISYGMPAFRLGGRVLVYYAAFTSHWSLFPGSKAVIDTFREGLGPRVTGPGTIRFAYDEPFPAGIVTAILQARLVELAAPKKR
jgi:uncharacterized protein YdhG (YjbR/CyaY superfamily)